MSDVTGGSGHPGDKRHVTIRSSRLHRSKRFAKTEQGADEKHCTDGSGRSELAPHDVEARTAVQDGLGNTHKMRRR